MTSKKRLVPITREFLAAHYEDLPIAPLPAALEACDAEAVGRVRARLDAAVAAGASSSSDAAAARAWLTPALAAELTEALVYANPKKIDENLYRTREQCEWAAHVLVSTARSALPTAVACALSEKLRAVCKRVEAFQDERRAQVTAMVRGFLPNDFRGQLIMRWQRRSESKAHEQIETLRRRGASVHDVYDALWDQQMERRRTLASLGNASGLFKSIVRVLAGIPSVMLDFVKRINDDQGPMEEMRVRYGPFGYALTRLGAHLRALATLCAHSSADAADHALLERFVDEYAAAVGFYLDFLVKVWERSPFFLEDYQMGDTLTAEPATELEVGRGESVTVTVAASAGQSVAWELESNKDIGFCVRLGDDELYPMTRVDAHKTKFKGSATVPRDGTVEIVFDNSFSYFTKKKVLYRTLVLDAADVGAGDLVDDDAGSEAADAAASSASPAVEPAAAS